MLFSQVCSSKLEMFSSGDGRWPSLDTFKEAKWRPEKSGDWEGGLGPAQENFDLEPESSPEQYWRSEISPDFRAGGGNDFLGIFCHFPGELFPVPVFASAAPRCSKEPARVKVSLPENIAINHACSHVFASVQKSGAKKEPQSQKIARTASKNFLNNSRELPVIAHENKGFEANRTRKFTRKFGEIFVVKVLWGTFSVPEKGRCRAGESWRRAASIGHASWGEVFAAQPHRAPLACAGADDGLEGGPLFRGLRYHHKRGTQNTSLLSLTKVFLLSVEKESPRQTKPKKGPKRKVHEFRTFFCEFWCFFLGKQARFTLNFCSGIPLRKLHELTFLWLGLPGPLLTVENKNPPGDKIEGSQNRSKSLSSESQQVTLVTWVAWIPHITWCFFLLFLH